MTDSAPCCHSVTQAPSILWLCCLLEFRVLCWVLYIQPADKRRERVWRISQKLLGPRPGSGIHHSTHISLPRLSHMVPACKGAGRCHLAVPTGGAEHTDNWQDQQLLSQMNWLIVRAYNGPFTNLHQAPGHPVVVYHRLLFSKLPGLTGAIFCSRGESSPFPVL